MSKLLIVVFTHELAVRLVSKQSQGVRFIGRIQKWISDIRSFGSRSIKGTNESTLDKDSSVPLMHHDPNGLRSQIRFWIPPKKRTHI